MIFAMSSEISFFFFILFISMFQCTIVNGDPTKVPIDVSFHPGPCRSQSSLKKDSNYIDLEAYNG